MSSDVTQLNFPINSFKKYCCKFYSGNFTAVKQRAITNHSNNTIIKQQRDREIMFERSKELYCFQDVWRWTEFLKLQRTSKKNNWKFYKL